MRQAADIAALAAFVARLRLDDVPDAVVARGARILVDCVGCIVAGQRTDEMRALLRGDLGRENGVATVLGRDVALPPAVAAFINGTAGTWHDLDEGNLHTKGHAGIQILPAAFAEAETTDRAGADLLLSLIAGYEVGCRIYGATAARLAVHPHGTFGPLAAAVAIAKQRNWPAERIGETIAVAATLGVAASRGTLRDGATVRNAYTGLSGRLGFVALELVEAGFTGERDALASVFGNIYGEQYTSAKTIGGLGAEWLILRNYFKLHPSGRYIHSAIDLLDAIRAAHDPLDPDSIERIDFETYAMAATMGQQTVDSAFGTRFSIPVVLASRLFGHDHDITADGTAAFTSPAVRMLAQRVFVAENPAFTADYPRLQRSRMQVRLKDGRTFDAAAERIKGEADHPHAGAELDRKFLSLVRPSWGAHAERALDALRTIDRIPSMRALGRDLRAMSSEMRP